LADLNEDRGNTLAKELGNQAIFVQVDVTSEGMWFCFKNSLMVRICEKGSQSYH